MTQVHFASMVFGCALGVLYTLLGVPNPAQIPIQRVLFKALPGILAFLLVSVATSWLLLALLTPVYGLLPTSAQIGLAVVIGVAASLLGPKLRDVLVTEKNMKRLGLPIALLVALDEFTRGYYKRILVREGRKLPITLASSFADVGEFHRVLSRLFEFHLIPIADYLARRNLVPAACFPGFFGIRAPEVKLGYLMNYLGYEDCRVLCSLDTAVTLGLFPLWPSAESERRSGVGTPPENPGYRKYDAPFVLRMIRAHYTVARTTA